MNPIIRKIQRTARIGLYGAIIIGIATLALYYLSRYRFYVNDYGHRLMLIGGAVLTVLVVAAILLAVRRTIPQIRQLDSLDERLQRYATHIANLYRSALAVATIDCTLIILSHDNTLFMLLLLLVICLVMLYPGSLKMKVDLGLTDEEFEQLFPDENL
ncbi:MAG: hypothetical protein AUK63_438 [bacterium P3]|nr:MAG: hypothetical protein AUK63_438 [bacterium P3]KWW42602.1 MAG: hypothetical protein F083_6 [bacterium F083]